MEEIDSTIRTKVWEWWTSLSYNEQDAIAKKNGDIYVYRCKYGILDSIDLLKMMEKEGVTQ